MRKKSVLEEWNELCAEYGARERKSQSLAAELSKYSPNPWADDGDSTLPADLAEEFRLARAAVDEHWKKMLAFHRLHFESIK